VQLKLLLTTATLGTALAVPASSSAQATTQDSVVLTTVPPRWPAPPNVFEVYTINATSGPSGENPTGQVYSNPA
jgi:hypothetical protein